MINISDPLKQGQVEDYFKDEYQQGDYFLSDGEPAVNGTWHGKGAERMGLKGEIREEDFLRLTVGQSPAGEQLVKFSRDENGEFKRVAYDATASAPKSFSLLAEIGGDERLIALHLKAKEVALRALEKQAMVRSGAKRNIDLRTGEVLYASFLHHENRNLEPQLHSHNVIFNLTWSPVANRGDGGWRALQPSGLYDAQAFATGVYRMEIAKGAPGLGYDIYIDEKGAPQIVGIGKEVLDAFSTRRAEIVEVVREAEDKARAEGRRLSKKERAQIASIAAKQTRQAKVKEVNREQLLEKWKSQSAALGFDPVGMVAQARARAAGYTTADLEAAAQDAQKAVRMAVDHAVEHLTERDMIIRQADVEANAVTNYEFYSKVTLEEVQEEINRRVEAGELVRDAKDRLTTRALQQLEKEMIGIVSDGRGKALPIGTVEEMVAARDALDEHGHAVSDDQKPVFEFLVRTSNQYIGVHGVAGAGKSYIFKRFAAYAANHGYVVRAFAPTISAVETLRRDGLNAVTVQSHVGSQSAQGDGTPGRKQEIWLVDEAGMLGAEDMHALLEKAEREFARVVLTGDNRQFSSVPGGRAFSQLMDTVLDSVEITAIIRQRAASEEVREAVRLLSEKKIVEGMGLLQQAGRVISIADDLQEEIDRTDERYRAVADLYVRHGGEVLVVTATNEERKEVNQAIRRTLIELGVVKAEGVETTIYANRNVTKADRKQAGNYHVGNMIQFAKVRHPHLKTFEWYEVKETDLGKNLVTVVRPDGTEVTYNPRYHYGVTDIFRVEEREFSRGDQIIFRGTNRAMGIRAGTLGTVLAVDEAGRVMVETKHGVVAFRLEDERRLDLAYVSTGHSAQGRTVDAAIVLSTSRHREEIVNLASIYVGASRTRMELYVVTDEYGKAVNAMSRKYVKDAALDLNRLPAMRTSIETPEEERARLIDENIRTRNDLYRLGYGKGVQKPEGYARYLEKKDIDMVRIETRKQQELLADLQDKRQAQLAAEQEAARTWQAGETFSKVAATAWEKLGTGDRQVWLEAAEQGIVNVADLKKKYGETVIREAVLSKAERLFTEDFTARELARESQHELSHSIDQALTEEKKDAASFPSDFIEPDHEGTQPERLRDRKVLGQKLTFELDLSQLRQLKEELIQQAELRRFVVLNEGVERESSRFDLEARAKIRARTEVEADGLRGEEKKLAAETSVTRERAAFLEVETTINAEFRKQVNRLEGAIAKKEAALETLLPIAAKAAERLSAVGPEESLPFLSRKALDRLQEDAVRRGDLETITHLEGIRNSQAREFNRPVHTPESAGRRLAQTRMAEIAAADAVERLEKFDQGGRFWNWKLEGADWSLADVERKLDQTAGAIRYLTIKLESLEAQPAGERTEADQTQAAGLRLRLDEVAGNAVTLTEVRDEIAIRMSETRTELAVVAGEHKALLQTLRDLSPNLPTGVEPAYSGYELMQMERLAASLRSPELLRESEAAAARFIAQENHIRTPHTRIEETAQASRAGAREFISGLERDKAKRALEKFEAFAGGKFEFTAGKLSPAAARLLLQRETLGREQVLGWQIRDVETTRQALTEQYEMRRYLVLNETADRESSVFDLERRAKLRAKGEAARLELKGEARKEYVDKAVREELERHHPTLTRLETEYREQVAALDARLEVLGINQATAAIAADRVRQEYRERGAAVPPAYIARTSLDALHDRFVRHRDMETIGELQRIRERQAAEFGQPEFVPESAGRVLGQATVAEIDSRLAEKRLADFDRGKEFWSWKIGDTEWSLNELDFALAGIGFQRQRLEFGFERLSAKLDRSWSWGEVRFLEARIEQVNDEYEALDGKEAGLLEIRRQVETKISETRADLADTAARQKEFSQFLSGITARLPAGTQAEFTGHELSGLERTAVTLSDRKLLREYEEAAADFAAQKAVIRSAETAIDRRDLAARAVAREEIAGLEVDRAGEQLAKFVLYRERKRVELEDGSRASLQDVVPTTGRDRFALHFTEARDGHDVTLSPDATLGERLERMAAHKSAAWLQGLEERFTQKGGRLAEIGNLVIKKIGAALGEDEQQTSRRRQIEHAIGAEENRLREKFETAHAFHAETTAIRDEHGAALEAQGKTMPAPLYTTREAIILETTGISHLNQELERKGVEAAVIAGQLKEAYGSAHPLERKAEYERERTYRRRIELEPVHKELTRERLSQAVETETRFHDANREIGTERRMELQSKGIAPPKASFTSKEAIRIEHAGIELEDRHLHKLGVEAARTAVKLKRDVGHAHPLGRRAEYEAKGRQTVPEPPAPVMQPTPPPVTGYERTVALAAAWETRMEEIGFGLNPVQSNQQFETILGSQWTANQHSSLAEAKASYEILNRRPTPQQAADPTVQPSYNRKPAEPTTAERQLEHGNGVEGISI